MPGCNLDEHGWDATRLPWNKTRSAARRKYLVTHLIPEAFQEIHIEDVENVCEDEEVNAELWLMVSGDRKIMSWQSKSRGRYDQPGAYYEHAVTDYVLHEISRSSRPPITPYELNVQHGKREEPRRSEPIADSTSDIAEPNMEQQQSSDKSTLESVRKASPAQIEVTSEPEAFGIKSAPHSEKSIPQPTPNERMSQPNSTIPEPEVTPSEQQKRSQSPTLSCIDANLSSMLASEHKD